MRTKIVDLRCPQCDRVVNSLEPFAHEVEILQVVPKVKSCVHCNTKLQVESDNDRHMAKSYYYVPKTTPVRTLWGQPLPAKKR